MLDHWPGRSSAGVAARSLAILAGLLCALGGASLLVLSAAGLASSPDPARGPLAIGLLVISGILPVLGLIRARRLKT